MVLSVIKKRVMSWFAPQLGVLRQYSPRPLNLPQRYAQTGGPTRPPKISIVTPSYNQAAYLEGTVRSVVEQGYPDLEYVVQDGGSKDGSVEILESYSDRLAFWESNKDKGQTNAINLGFLHTSGEIMAYLNSDDMLLPGALAYVAAYFETHPDVDVVYGHRIIIDETDQEIGRWILPPHDNEVLSWADFIPQETLFWRRRVWDKIGGSLDESFHFAMDWDLLLRLRDSGAKFVRLPRFLAAFRVHPQQKTSTEITDTGFKEMGRLRERCHGRVVSAGEIKRGVAAYVARHIVYDKLQQWFRN
ncbi:MAG: glycosyltransferase [Sulfuricellaceae bacterium]|nr:glycosyltransferase [Sulfuricellaceae bacterium]